MLSRANSIRYPPISRSLQLLFPSLSCPFPLLASNIPPNHLSQHLSFHPLFNLQSKTHLILDGLIAALRRHILTHLGRSCDVRPCCFLKASIEPVALRRRSDRSHARSSTLQLRYRARELLVIIVRANWPGAGAAGSVAGGNAASMVYLARSQPTAKALGSFGRLNCGQRDG